MVMYRDFAARKARSLSITGEVWNEDDGTVSVIGEGEEKKLLSYIEELKKGSFLAHVERAQVAWKEPAGEFTDFVIRYRS